MKGTVVDLPAPCAQCAVISGRRLRTCSSPDESPTTPRDVHVARLASLERRGYLTLRFRSQWAAKGSSELYEGSAIAGRVAAAGVAAATGSRRSGAPLVDIRGGPTVALAPVVGHCQGQESDEA